MGNFYPERLDIFWQAQELTKSLGGELKVHSLSWKYSWIDSIFGRALAKRAQVTLPMLKWSAIKRWDEALSRVQNRDVADSLGR